MDVGECVVCGKKTFVTALTRTCLPCRTEAWKAKRAVDCNKLVVVESTASGPENPFFEMWKNAQEAAPREPPEWQKNLVFYRDVDWARHEETTDAMLKRLLTAIDGMNATHLVDSWFLSRGGEHARMCIDGDAPWHTDPEEASRIQNVKEFQLRPMKPKVVVTYSEED